MERTESKYRLGQEVRRLVSEWPRTSQVRKPEGQEEHGVREQALSGSQEIKWRAGSTDELSS